MGYSVKLISWNVNGIRAAIRNGLLDFVSSEKADVYAFQEIKADEFQVPPDLAQNGYVAYVNPARRKGYSGTLVLTRVKPASTITGFGEGDEEDEGRIIGLEFPDFWFFNVYFPNSQRGLARLDYKIKFDNRLKDFLNEIRSTKPVVIQRKNVSGCLISSGRVMLTPSGFSTRNPETIRGGLTDSTPGQGI